MSDTDRNDKLPSTLPPKPDPLEEWASRMEGKLDTLIAMQSDFFAEQQRQRKEIDALKSDVAFLRRTILPPPHEGNGAADG